MNKKRLKKWAKIFAIVKLPFMIYLIVSISSVPTIDAIAQKGIKGAHRGNSVDYTENTLEAFNSAVEQPEYHFIEFDIQFSKDKKIVVLHQNDMFHIPKNFVEISEMNYDELQTYFDFKIPQYHEVMNCINGKKPVNIEIKSHGNFENDKELVEFVILDCEKRGIINQIMISSPSGELIEYIEENHPEIKTGKVYWITPDSIIPLESTTRYFYECSNADYIQLHGYNIKNYDLLISCKPEDKGLIFWYFTDEMYIVDNPDGCEGFWDNSVSQIK